MFIVFLIMSFICLIAGVLFVIYAKPLEEKFIEKNPNSTAQMNRIGGIIMIVLGVVAAVLAFVFADVDLLEGGVSNNVLFYLAAVATVILIIMAIVGFKAKKGVAKPIICLVLASACLVGAVFWAQGTSSISDDSVKDFCGNDKYDIASIAKTEIEQRLKAPSTAKFCSTSQMSITLDDNTWTVSGWVDAQNSFGATIRSQFTIKITFKNSYQYTVDSCVIE